MIQRGIWLAVDATGEVQREVVTSWPEDVVIGYTDEESEVGRNFRDWFRAGHQEVVIDTTAPAQVTLTLTGLNLPEPPPVEPEPDPDPDHALQRRVEILEEVANAQNATIGMMGRRIDTLEAGLVEVREVLTTQEGMLTNLLRDLSAILSKYYDDILPF